MSFWDTTSDNKFEIRCKKGLVSELYTINPLTDEFERVTPGGSEPAPELPAWVKIDRAYFKDQDNNNSTTLNSGGLSFADDYGKNSSMGFNNVNFVDSGGQKSANLKSDQLSFTTVDGTSSIGKDEAAAAGTVSTFLKSSVNNTVNGNCFAMLYNNATKRLDKTNWIRLLFDANRYNTMTGVENTIYNSNSSSSMNGNRVYHYTGSFKVSSLEGGYVFSGSATSQSSGNPDLSKDYARLYADRLELKDVNGIKTLNKDDIITTNNLKSLASLVPNATTKMITFNPSSKLFTYSDMPSPPIPRFRYVQVYPLSIDRFALAGLVNTGGNPQVTYIDNDLTSGFQSSVVRGYPLEIGLAGTDELSNGDIFYLDFNQLPVTTFTSSHKRAVFPITIAGGDYSDPYKLPILSALPPIQSKISVKLEYGKYFTPLYPEGPRCHMVVVDYTGATFPYPYKLQVPIKLECKHPNSSDPLSS